MTQRRILHLASIRWNSAIAEYALSSARALNMVGNITKLITLDESPLMKRAVAHGLDVTGIPSFAMTQVLRARTVIADFKPDLIVTHGGPETLLAGFACVGKTPMFRVRGYAVSSGMLTGMAYDIGQLGVKGIIAPSDSIAEELKKISKIPSGAVPLGIDCEKYFPSPEYQTAPRPTMLIFGRFDPVKGHREFMKLFRLILNKWDSGVKPQLRIVGEPANLSVRHLEEFAAEEGLIWDDQVVVAAERVADVRKLLAEATVGVVSSVGSEIICRVAEEFLLCGTPVIVSGVGSLKEVLVTPQMGMCYGGMDLEVAAQEIIKHFKEYTSESPIQRQTRAAQALQEFSLETMGQRLEAFIAESQQNRY